MGCLFFKRKIFSKVRLNFKKYSKRKAKPIIIIEQRFTYLEYRNFSRMSLNETLKMVKKYIQRPQLSSPLNTTFNGAISTKHGLIEHFWFFPKGLNGVSQWATKPRLCFHVMNSNPTTHTIKSVKSFRNQRKIIK